MRLDDDGDDGRWGENPRQNVGDGFLTAGAVWDALVPWRLSAAQILVKQPALPCY